jgi:hypothetical protein
MVFHSVASAFKVTGYTRYTLFSPNIFLVPIPETPAVHFLLFECETITDTCTSPHTYFILMRKLKARKLWKKKDNSMGTCISEFNFLFMSLLELQDGDVIA